MKPARLIQFARLTASTDDAGVKATIKSALALVREKGLGEVAAKQALEG